MSRSKQINMFIPQAPPHLSSCLQRKTGQKLSWEDRNKPNPLEPSNSKMNMNENERFDGGPKLPIGYRFRPTDEELILHYLKPKLLSFPFPSSVIPHYLHLFHSHPSLFLGMLTHTYIYTHTCICMYIIVFDMVFFG